jgi:hypothetical protein
MREHYDALAFIYGTLGGNETPQDSRRDIGAA